MKGLGAILRNHICGRTFTPSFYLQENYGSPEEHPWELPIEVDGIDAMHKRGVFELPGGQIHVDSASQTNVTRISLRLQVDPYVPFSVNRGYVQNVACEETYLAISGFPRSLYPNHGIVSPSPSVNTNTKELRVEVAEPSLLSPQAPTESSATSLRSKLSSMRMSRPVKLEQSHISSWWSDLSSTTRGSQTTTGSVAELPGQDTFNPRFVESREDEPLAEKTSDNYY